MRNLCFDKGFTLIELLVVIAIFAVGVSIAVPAFSNIGKKSLVKSSARKVKDSLYKARMKAIEINKSIVFEVDEDENSYSVFIEDTDVVIESYKFNNIYIDIDSGSSVTWNTKGYVSNSCEISLKNENGEYDIQISSSGNIKITSP